MNHTETKDHEAISAETERIARDVIDCSFRVHRTLGPGLLESAYETCVAYELTRCGLNFRRQVALPIIYEGVTLEVGYRIDLLIEETIIVEIKSIDALQSIHQAQLMTYLKLSRLRLGFLMNFNVYQFKLGIKRIVF